MEGDFVHPIDHVLLGRGQKQKLRSIRQFQSENIFLLRVILRLLAVGIQNVNRSGGRLLLEEIIFVLEEAQQLTAQHRMERFP